MFADCSRGGAPPGPANAKPAGGGNSSGPSEFANVDPRQNDPNTNADFGGNGKPENGASHHDDKRGAEVQRALNNSRAAMRAAASVDDKLRILHDGAAELERLGDDGDALGDLSDCAINIGLDPDSVQQMLAGGWQHAQDTATRADVAKPETGHTTNGSQGAEGLRDNPAPGIKPLRLNPPVSLHDFLAMEIKPREMVLGPIIPEKGLVMLYAPRGVGKTHVSHGIAYSAATGTEFLRWIAPKPYRVLVVDGEMPAALLQERFATIVAGAAVKAAPDRLKILASDMMEEGGVGNLASPKVQKEIDQYLDGVELLILDNLSSLTAVIRDNDAESWTTLQEWLLRLRRRGTSVLINHHAGKGGQQRGTSRREDVLDTCISLRRPEDYTADQGARFEVHIEKGRGIFGDDAKPFEAQYEIRANAAVWTTRDLADVEIARVRALANEGMSVRDIASELGMAKSRVQRLKDKIKKSEGGSNADEH